MTIESTGLPWIVTGSYEGPERRVYVPTPKQVQAQLELLEHDINEMFAAHEEREKSWFEQFREECNSAYPNGDRRGHCEAHEAMIAAKRAEEEFYTAAKTEFTRRGIAGLSALIKWALILLLLSLAYKLGLGPVMAKLLGVAP